MKIGLKNMNVLILFVLISCSKDDGSSIDPTSEPDVNIILIGEDVDKVYQYEYNALSDTAVQSDLTQELGLGTSYLTLRQEGEWLSFYTFSSGNFSLIQKNVATNANSLEANFYMENDERSILWGTNDVKKLYLGNFKPQDSSNFGVLTIDIQSGSQKELIIENDIQTSYQPIYHQGKLILTYRDKASNYKVAIVDTATDSVIRRLEFGALVPNIFFDVFGDVIILRSNQGENYSYAIYNASTFETTGNADFSLTRYFDPGFLTARLIEQELFYYSLYAQPAEVLFGPASFDFITNVETLIDMERIVNQVEIENGRSIQLISQGIDGKSRTYLVGYANLNNTNTLDGGMLIISFEGELIKHIDLPFVPTYFLTRE